jgi:alpha-D-ribose 1-methylphosphonate 5-triphosphate synthase subunit PhnH
MHDHTLLAGFADPVADSQRTFRALMQALANPGQAVAVAVVAPVSAPAPLDAGVAAVILTLCDFETALYLHGPWQQPAVVDYVRFHTGTKLTQHPSEAQFAALASTQDLDPLSRFAQGTADYPDRSTTVIAAAAIGPARWRLQGPGIDGVRTVAAPIVPPGFAAAWQANTMLFPRGVDIVFVTAHGLIGLPRTTRILEG